jgi:hypothetical protein
MGNAYAYLNEASYSGALARRLGIKVGTAGGSMTRSPQVPPVAVKAGSLNLWLAAEVEEWKIERDP